MDKLQDKRIELAKRVLDTTDAKRLDAVEIALMGPAPIAFSKKEIQEMENLVERINAGKEKTYSWAEVRRNALRRTKK